MMLAYRPANTFSSAPRPAPRPTSVSTFAGARRGDVVVLPAGLLLLLMADDGITIKRDDEVAVAAAAGMGETME